MNAGSAVYGCGHSITLSTPTVYLSTTQSVYLVSHVCKGSFHFWFGAFLVLVKVECMRHHEIEMEVPGRRYCDYVNSRSGKRQFWVPVSLNGV